MPRQLKIPVNLSSQPCENWPLLQFVSSCRRKQGNRVHLDKVRVGLKALTELSITFNRLASRGMG